MSIETIRLSQKAKDQLVTLKRATGIEHWNVLCRWAFCLSLAEPTPPPQADIPSDSNVEITWKTFAGTNHALLMRLFYYRCHKDNIGTEDLKDINQYFKLHIMRGIGYLFHYQITNKSLIRSILN